MVMQTRGNVLKCLQLEVHVLHADNKVNSKLAIRQNARGLSL